MRNILLNPTCALLVGEVVFRKLISTLWSPPPFFFLFLNPKSSIYSRAFISPDQEARLSQSFGLGSVAQIAWLQHSLQRALQI